VQDGVREDGVELGVVGQVADVAGFEGEAGKVVAGLGDHGGGAVGTEHLGAGAGDLRGEMAGAAADIEDALTGLGGEESEKVAAELPDEGVGGVVESGVPVGRHPLIVIGA
jgi:hypothetical protein